MFHVLKSENQGLILRGLTWTLEQELFDDTRRSVGFFTCPTTAQRVADLLNAGATVATIEAEEFVSLGEVS
jgi:hypothetical protein